MVYSRRQPGDWRALSLIWGVEIPLLTWASPRDGADCISCSLMTNRTRPFRGTEWGWEKRSSEPRFLYHPAFISLQMEQTDSKRPPKSPLSCLLKRWAEADKEAGEQTNNPSLSATSPGVVHLQEFGSTCMRSAFTLAKWKDIRHYYSLPSNWSPQV